MRVFVKVVCLVIAVWVGFSAVRAMKGSDSSPAIAGAGSMQDLAVRNQDIAFYQKRLTEDPKSAEDLAQLGGLYLQRAREAGDYEDFRRAEAAARRSVELRTQRNGKAQMLLASSLLAQHRFAEARKEAELLVAMDPDVIGYRALLAEIQMELGDYAVAEKSFRGLMHASENLAVAPRLARWNEINGQPGVARKILKQSLATARGSDIPREQVAWFFLRLGDFNLRYGAADAAENVFREGLRYEPNDFRLMSGLARVEFVRGNWRQAISYALRTGDHADLATLSLLGDSYRALGDSTRAAAMFEQVVQQARANPEPYNRQWTQFMLDHQYALPEALSVLQREIAERPDVLGYDQLAWAYHLTGDKVRATAAIERALRMGTQDAMLHFHAAEIAFARGDVSKARKHFKRVMEINPSFHPIWAPQARSRLAALGRV